MSDRNSVLYISRYISIVKYTPDNNQGLDITYAHTVDLLTVWNTFMHLCNPERRFTIY